MENIKLLIKAASILLESALKPSQFRPFIKEAILKKQYKQYLDNIFKGKDRIYLPFETIDIKDIPHSIRLTLREKGYEITDYKSGLAKNKNGRLIKIGKVLSQEENSKELLEEFQKSRSSVKQELQIVISRHPYDVAGMTTGRHWDNTSCMEINKKEGSKYIHKDIEYGTLVAYVIRKNDTNIKHPISRILIKQFINSNNSGESVLYPEKEMYGEQLVGFREKLIQWLETFQTIRGFYKLNPELYNDGTTFLGDSRKTSEDKDERLHYYKNNPKDRDAKTDSYIEIRKIYYDNHPDDLSAKFDESQYIVINYYRTHIDDPDVKTIEDDSYETGRLKIRYYMNHPNDEDAKKEGRIEIREQYYYRNPNDEDAKKDSSEKIRLEYYSKHPNDPGRKKEREEVRFQYYIDNPNDNDIINESFKFKEKFYSMHNHDTRAKIDTDEEIQKMYLEKHHDDTFFKTHENRNLRKLYYQLNPDDGDALYDDDMIIRLHYATKHKQELDPELVRKQLKKKITI